MTTGATGSAPEPFYHPTTGERLYARPEAVRLARRVLCDGSEGGHVIVSKGRMRTFSGQIQHLGYGCENCDVRVMLNCPEV